MKKILTFIDSKKGFLRSKLRKTCLKKVGMTKQDHVNFWINDNLKNIIPPGTEHPAGWDEMSFLKKVLGLLDFSDAFELGCGYGRLSRAFVPDKYLGIDINPLAIKKAKKHNPTYSYSVIDFDSPCPAKDLCLAYTVFLHIADEFIREVISRIAKSVAQVLVVEILGRKWRAGSKVPVFNREREEYIDLLSNVGFLFEMEIKRSYKRYRNTEISFLYFKKKNLSKGSDL